MVGLCVTLSLAMLSGLVMFSIYKNCDPFTNGDVGSTDQVLLNPAITQAPVYTLNNDVFAKKTQNKTVASLPGHGHLGCLPWNPWFVCGCRIQWHPEVRLRREKCIDLE